MLYLEYFPTTEVKEYSLTGTSLGNLVMRYKHMYLCEGPIPLIPPTVFFPKLSIGTPSYLILGGY